MKIARVTLKGFVAYMVVFMLIQPGAMYLFARVWQWNFFLSGFLSATLAAYPAFWARVAVEKKETGQQ
jgi:hypothetical protein